MSEMPARVTGLGTRDVLIALPKLASAISISTSTFMCASCDSAASLGFPPSNLHAAQYASLLRPTFALLQRRGDALQIDVHAPGLRDLLLVKLDQACSGRSTRPHSAGARIP